MMRRILLLAMLVPGAVPAWAQPAPPRPPAAAPAVPAPAGPARKPVTPAASQPAAPKPGTVKPATPKPVKPGSPKPGNARPHTAPRPATPAIVPIVPPEPEPPAAPTKGTHSGLALPRFASLRSDEVYMRAGPGPRYPIDWVYKRRDYPVEIEREFDIWRLVRDVEGVRGWVNTQTLAPRRSGVVLPGPVERALRKEPRDDSPAIARLKPGVIVRLRSCDAASDWCAAQIQDYRGFVRRTDVWGVYPGEAVQ